MRKGDGERDREDEILVTTKMVFEDVDVRSSIVQESLMWKLDILWNEINNRNKIEHKYKVH